MVHSNFHSKPDKAMTPEQFTQVVEAILAGKYSWACVLILRFAGYNPLHYISYRTYNRLMKENCREQANREQAKKRNKPEDCYPNTQHETSEKFSSYLADPSHLKTLEEQTHKIEDNQTAWLN